MKEVKTVLIQVVEKPARKVIIKRGREAKDYWKYCEEVGCDVWGLLTSMKAIDGEPVCLWLPPRYIKPNTSEYVQGVEVPADYERITRAGQGKSGNQSVQGSYPLWITARSAF